MDRGEFGKNIIGKKMIVLLAVTGAVYFFLQYLTPLLAPVLLAMLFVTIFGPMMKRMNRKLHFPRPLSAIVLLILATLLLAVLLWVLSSWVRVWMRWSRSGWRRSGTYAAAWERSLVWTLPIWKIRSAADCRRDWIRWRKIFCRGCCRNPCSMCGGLRSLEDSW